MDAAVGGGYQVRGDSVEVGRGVFCAEGRVLRCNRGGVEDDGVPGSHAAQPLALDRHQDSQASVWLRPSRPAAQADALRSHPSGSWTPPTANATPMQSRPASSQRPSQYTSAGGLANGPPPNPHIAMFGFGLVRRRARRFDGRWGRLVECRHRCRLGLRR